MIRAIVGVLVWAQLAKITRSQTNLIVDGDLENIWVGSVGPQGFAYSTQVSAAEGQGWLKLPGSANSYYTVKAWIRHNKTKGLELANFGGPYEICQVLDLEEGASYSLTFSMFCPPDMTATEPIVKLDGS